MKFYSPYQFGLFRIILGLYLTIHFIVLVPYAAEIWSNSGIFPDPSINMTHGIIPNILHYLSAPFELTVFVILMSVLSFLLMIGWQRPIVSLFLWYGWICLFDRNNLISNPGLPYVGWILLCCMVIPKGEALSLSKSSGDKAWQFPVILFIGAWVLMSVGYTISGFDKFQSPSWRDGSAIFHLLENPLSRDWWLRDLMLSLPDWIIKIKTWGILSLEMLFAPLALIPITRKWVWLAMILMHLGILMIVDFADLTMGMLMIHWLTFDSRWLSAKAARSGIVYFDGVCGMCNSIVDFLIRNDSNHSLQFAPLQGATAGKHLDPKSVVDLKTIIYQSGDRTYSHSDAVLLAISSMGGIWKLVVILRVIPRFIRDKVYNYVAKNRYRWFGKKESCRMPTPEERGRILE